MSSLAQLIRRTAQVCGDKTATRFNGRSHSWREFQQRISHMAGGLRSLGLGEGDRAACLALNSDRYLEFYFGVAWSGAVFVPINIRLAPAEILYWLNDSGSKVLFVDVTFLPAITEIHARLETIEHFVYMSDDATPQGYLSFEDLVTNHAPIDATERSGDDLVAIYYTGGTTGRSKGVMLSHRNLTYNVLQSAPELKIVEDDVYLHSAPMFHIADTIGGMVASTVGATHVFVPAFDPVKVLKIAQDEKVTVSLLVPTMINMLVNHQDLPDYDLSSLKNMPYGGSGIPEAVLLKAFEVLPDTTFVQAYGQTEASPIVTLLGRKYHTVSGPYAGKLTAAGKAVPGIDLAILNEQGEILPIGEVGEVCIRGDNVLFVVDRVKDMIVSGGENVYSAETEQAIYTHPAVAECAVIGIPHDEWGEQVHAIVRLHEGASVTDQQLIDHCKTLIAAFKGPKSIEFREQPLPLIGAGKILKKDLRAPYWEGQDRNVG